MAERFWETKSLAEMSEKEWESLCDGCGLCCLVRLEDLDTGEVTPTCVACRLLDETSCRCSNYAHRTELVPDCVKLTPRNIAALSWMPASCAYRRLHEGRALPAWHPLLTGDPESVHKARVSVRGRTINEDLLESPEDAARFLAPSFMKDRGEEPF
ncbi:MAG: YcgN family cysteine cluster protein [Caulobacteraceae bacterium]